MKHLNYWERLQSLKMISIQRQMEHYSIILTLKILEGLMPNCGIEEIRSQQKGRRCKISPMTKIQDHLENGKKILSKLRVQDHSTQFQRN